MLQHLSYRAKVLASVIRQDVVMCSWTELIQTTQGQGQRTLIQIFTK